MLGIASRRALARRIVRSVHSGLPELMMPFTPQKYFKEHPLYVEKADGVYYTDSRGRQIVDGCAGLWCCNSGHNRVEIADAINAQMQVMDFAPTFQLCHPKVEEAAEALTASSGFDHVFFGNSGSEAADTSLKMSLAYNVARGKPHRKRFIGREKAYHGVGFGGITVGGLPNNRRQYLLQLLPHVNHLSVTHDPLLEPYIDGKGTTGLETAEELMAMIDQYRDPSNGTDDKGQPDHDIACVMVEPVAGSAGVIPPPVGYLERLREICDEHDILLIFDEVITGFGRVGSMLATHEFDVKPDIVGCAKGLTNGVIPMGCNFMTDEVYQTILGEQSVMQNIEFAHGYTYSGHPIAAAAAIANLKLMHDEDLFNKNETLGASMSTRIQGLKDSEAGQHINSIRTIGSMAAIDLKPVPEQPLLTGLTVMRSTFEKGSFVRVAGDTICVSPPLIAEDEHIERIVDALGKSIVESYQKFENA